LVDRFSRWIGVDATQLAKAAHVAGEGLHPDPCLGPDQADRAHRLPPLSLACAPKICLSRTRTVDLVRLARPVWSLTGLPRSPLQ
jgi:hypothetical protein